MSKKKVSKAKPAKKKAVKKKAVAPVKKKKPKSSTKAKSSSKKSAPKRPAKKSEDVLSAGEKIEELTAQVAEKEEEILRTEKNIAKTEREILRRSDDIESTALRILRKIREPPMRRVTRQDINKGIVGSFFGLVSHFAFLSSGKVIDAISLHRAIFILVMTYIIAYVMIEKTGYRTIREQRVFRIIPARVTVIYFTALIVSLFVLLLFDQLHSFNLAHLIKTVAVTSILAIPGAAGAHMLGH